MLQPRLWWIRLSCIWLGSSFNSLVGVQGWTSCQCHSWRGLDLLRELQQGKYGLLSSVEVYRWWYCSSRFLQYWVLSEPAPFVENLVEPPVLPPEARSWPWSDRMFLLSYWWVGARDFIRSFRPWYPSSVPSPVCAEVFFDVCRWFIVLLPYNLIMSLYVHFFYPTFSYPFFSDKPKYVFWIVDVIGVVQIPLFSSTTLKGNLYVLLSFLLFVRFPTSILY